MEREVSVKLDGIELVGNTNTPENAKGIIIFAHGSGSSRFSPRNKMVADVLNRAGLATLLFDLLTEDEEQQDILTAEYRFNIPMISDRLVGATKWLLTTKEWSGLKIGYFGASTGAAAALNAAAECQKNVYAIVARGGRPDLADSGMLAAITTPCLFIVGGNDNAVIDMNKNAISKMTNTKGVGLKIIPGATHLFEESGKLEQVAEIARDFYLHHLD